MLVVSYAHQEMQTVIKAIDELVEEGKPRWDWSAPEVDEALRAQAVAAGVDLVRPTALPRKPHGMSVGRLKMLWSRRLPLKMVRL